MVVDLWCELLLPERNDFDLRGSTVCSMDLWVDLWWGLGMDLK